MKKIKNILICGKPGVGKTTLIRKVARDLGKRASGFYTEEIREKGEILLSPLCPYIEMNS